jgi:hypothetical protein
MSNGWDESAEAATGRAKMFSIRPFLSASCNAATGAPSMSGAARAACAACFRPGLSRRSALTRQQHCWSAPAHDSGNHPQSASEISGSGGRARS